MSVGMLDHLTQASHIAAGMDIPFSEAMDLVKAAQEFAELDEPVATEESNVVYGVDFINKKPKGTTLGTL